MIWFQEIPLESISDFVTLSCVIMVLYIMFSQALSVAAHVPFPLYFLYIHFLRPFRVCLSSFQKTLQSKSHLPLQTSGLKSHNRDSARSLSLNETFIRLYIQFHQLQPLDEYILLLPGTIAGCKRSITIFQNNNFTWHLLYLISQRRPQAASV